MIYKYKVISCLVIDIMQSYLSLLEYIITFAAVLFILHCFSELSEDVCEPALYWVLFNLQRDARPPGKRVPFLSYTIHQGRRGRQRPVRSREEKLPAPQVSVLNPHNSGRTRAPAMIKKTNIMCEINQRRVSPLSTTGTQRNRSYSISWKNTKTRFNLVSSIISDMENFYFYL